MIRVLLAESRSDVRSALRFLLEQTSQVTVIKEITRSCDICPAVQRDNADWLVLDWEMPGLKAEQLVAEIREKFKSLKILATGSSSGSRVQSIDAGVDAFVSKADAPETFLEAIGKITGVWHWPDGQLKD